MEKQATATERRSSQGRELRRRPIVAGSSPADTTKKFDEIRLDCLSDASSESEICRAGHYFTRTQAFLGWLRLNPTRRWRVGVPTLEFCIRKASLNAMGPVHIRHAQARAFHAFTTRTSHLLAPLLSCSGNNTRACWHYELCRNVLQL